MIDTVIWDWNGTLLDDVQACLDSENELLEARGFAVIDKARYLEIFGFPVIDYYRRAGFTFATETYEAVADEYHALYFEKSKRCGLFADAAEALAALRDAGKRQLILSASESGLLMSQLAPMNIADYFIKVIGQDDVLAHGKIDAARRWMDEQGVDARGVALIGDTIHDYETASALGAFCVLVPNGHQSRGRLAGCVGCRCVTADSLTEAAGYIINNL